MLKPNCILSLVFVTCLVLLAGCGDGTTQEPGVGISQDPAVTKQVNAILTQGVGSLGFSCDETATGKMKCICIKGASTLPWRCSGMDKMCKILDAKKNCRPTDGWCDCIEGKNLQ